MRMLINFGVILLAMAIWGILHSITASLWAKAQAREIVSTRTTDGTYRLLYNLIAIFTFAPVLVLPGLLIDTPIYRFPNWALFLTLPVQIAALFGMAVSLWRVNLMRFFGVRQFIRLLHEEPDPRDPPVLVTKGIHRWVRHPLYFFSLLFIWLTPVMTANILAFNIGVTIYFRIGSIFEERKLVQEFGTVYREHQQTVPRLFPFPRQRTK